MDFDITPFFRLFQNFLSIPKTFLSLKSSQKHFIFWRSNILFPLFRINQIEFISNFECNPLQMSEVRHLLSHSHSHSYVQMIQYQFSWSTVSVCETRHQKTKLANRYCKTLFCNHKSLYTLDQTTPFDSHSSNSIFLLLTLLYIRKMNLIE
jgi:hypothetical protein